MSSFHTGWMAGPARFCLAGAFLLLSFGLSGCGGVKDPLGRKAVSGKVDFDGKPLAEGSITFQPIGDQPSTKVTSSGGVIQNGKYTIDAQHGLPAGKYVVSISATEAAPDISKLSPDEQMKAARDAKPAQQLIPPKYNSKSELIAEVSDNKASVFDFDLKSKP